jgi:hypothetical protein
MRPSSRRFTRSNESNRSRRGGVLLEFAIVALVFYVLFAAVTDMGRATFMASTANDAARLMARELARTPLPANYNFREALGDPRVTGAGDPANPGIYDARYLVVDLDTLADGESLDAFFADKPLVNRALRPLMIFDSPVIDGSQKRLYRYPGALLKKTNTEGSTDQYLVAIPIVDNVETGAGSAVSQVTGWLPVVQEVRAIPPGMFIGPGDSPFDVRSPDGGVAAIRINVPFQSSTTSSYAVDPAEPLAEQELLSVVYADAPPGPVPPAGTVVFGEAELMDAGAFGNESGAYAGQLGLGKFYALGGEVRPFRRILSGQAVFRREVFGRQLTSTP